MINPLAIGRAALVMLALLIATPGLAPALARDAGLPEASTDIISLDDVRVGMKGYGLTVYHGTKIEPFPVEVISVMKDFAPKRGVIWIKCTDQRMTTSGPVAGMSGSPIYLWPKGKEGKLGEGGRLAGAFAYGYNGVKICYAGVQPIELMLDVASRAAKQPGDDDKADKGKNDRGDKGDDRAGDGDDKSPPAPPMGQAMPLARVLQQTLDVARTQRGATDAWRIKAILDAVDPKPSTSASTSTDGSRLRLSAQLDTHPDKSPRTHLPRTLDEASAHRMMLPVAVGSSETAAMMKPLMQPLGLMPVSAPRGGMAGNPPADYDLKNVKLAPGSVLSIPLGYGDLDLSAVGTVTDVLPDGRVIAFGHPMFGNGESSLPVATGFVHYVVPRYFGSFKLSGSGKIVAGLVRDEGAAIAARPDGRFHTSPLRVFVNMPKQKPATYNYRIVRHRSYTAMITGLLAVESLAAVQGLPDENTLRIRGTLKFAGNRQLEIDSIVAGASPFSAYASIGPSVGAMLNNSYEPVPLESAEVRLDVEPVTRAATIIGGRLDQARVAPGDTVAMTLKLQPYGGKVFTKRITLKIPADAAEGRYNIVVGAASTYQQSVRQLRPHRARIGSVDDLFDVLKDTMSLQADAIYAVMPLQSRGLAIGRTELPRLPSSKAAVIDSALNTEATPFLDHVESVTPTDYVISGGMGFAVEVTREARPAK